MRLLRRRAPKGPLSCAEVAQVLQEYLDGELGDATAELVEDHLEQCRRCGLEAETYQSIKESLRRGAPTLPDDSVDRLRDFAGRLARGEVSDDSG